MQFFVHSVKVISVPISQLLNDVTGKDFSVIAYHQK